MQAAIEEMRRATDKMRLAEEKVAFHNSIQRHPPGVFEGIRTTRVFSLFSIVKHLFEQDRVRKRATSHNISQLEVIYLLSS